MFCVHWILREWNSLPNNYEKQWILQILSLVLENEIFPALVPIRQRVQKELNRGKERRVKGHLNCFTFSAEMAGKRFWVVLLFPLLSGTTWSGEEGWNMIHAAEHLSLPAYPFPECIVSASFCLPDTMEWRKKEEKLHTSRREVWAIPLLTATANEKVRQV